MFEACSDFFASFVSCFRTDAHAAPLRRQLVQGLAQARLVRYPVIQWYTIIYPTRHNIHWWLLLSLLKINHISLCKRQQSISGISLPQKSSLISYFWSLVVIEFFGTNLENPYLREDKNPQLGIVVSGHIDNLLRLMISHHFIWFHSSSIKAHLINLNSPVLLNHLTTWFSKWIDIYWYMINHD